ncbi:MAG: LysE family translocator [Pseudomonadota bacterium]
MLEAYLITITGVILAQASPGPNLLAVASAGLGQGRAAALATVAGVATGMFIWATAVAFGLAAVLALYPTLLTAMKIIGGSYLCWMALKAVKAAWADNTMSIQAGTQSMSLLAHWRRGLLVIMTNPKAALMWTAVGTFLFGSGLSAWQVVAFGPLAALTAIMIYGGYGLLFSSGFATRTYSRFARWIELAFGGAFAALGGTLLLDGLRELRKAG